MAKNKRRPLSVAHSAYLHEDLMIEIMSRVPAKSLLRLKSVSKQWKSMVEDPTFIALHHKRAHSRPDGVSLLISINPMPHLSLFSAPYQGGPACPLLQNHPQLKDYKASPSTHGLILLYPKSCLVTDEPVFVFNPTTRELVQLPPLEKNDGFNIQFWVHFYLGFDPLSGVYKVLSLCSSVGYVPNQLPQEKTGSCNLYNVLTLGTKEWRKLGTPNLPRVELAPNYSCCVNGAIYFKANPYHEHDFIAAFDVGEENFRLVSQPRAPPMHLLMKIGGGLALREKTNVVWILEDQNQDKWIRMKLQNSHGDETYNIIGGVDYSSNKFLLAPQYQMDAEHQWVYYGDNSGEEWPKFQITGLPDIINRLPHYFMTMKNIETLFSPSAGLQ